MATSRRVVEGRIVAVELLQPGAGYVGPNVVFTSVAGGDPAAQPAKGDNAIIVFGHNASGGIASLNLANPGANYLPGTENGPLPNSPATALQFGVATPYARTIVQASGWAAKFLPPNLSVGQVVYDSLIVEHAGLGSISERPFGGSFGGKSGPDGYGLGNQLSATAKLAGILFNAQQYYASIGLDLPDFLPSDFAFNSGNTVVGAYEWPIYYNHQPFLTLSGALQTWIQSLQRTLSLFQQKTPYANTPAASDWTMQYFSQYDEAAGRVLINPSGTIPVNSVMSSVWNPPTIPDAETPGYRSPPRIPATSRETAATIASPPTPDSWKPHPRPSTSPRKRSAAPPAPELRSSTKAVLP
jgi:hypothetical protein